MRAYDRAFVLRARVKHAVNAHTRMPFVRHTPGSRARLGSDSNVRIVQSQGSGAGAGAGEGVGLLAVAQPFAEIAHKVRRPARL